MSEFTAPTYRRWFQFGLGAMFLGVTVVAVIAAWIAWQGAVARDRATLIKSIYDRGGSVYSVAELQLQEMPEQLPRVRQWFGDQSIDTIFIPPPAFTEDDLARIKAAFPEAYIWPGRLPARAYVAAPEKLAL